MLTQLLHHKLQGHHARLASGGGGGWRRACAGLASREGLMQHSWHRLVEKSWAAPFVAMPRDACWLRSATGLPKLTVPAVPCVARLLSPHLAMGLRSPGHNNLNITFVKSLCVLQQNQPEQQVAIGGNAGSVEIFGGADVAPHACIEPRACMHAIGKPWRRAPEEVRVGFQRPCQPAQVLTRLAAMARSPGRRCWSVPTSCSAYSVVWTWRIGV